MVSFFLSHLAGFARDFRWRTISERHGGGGDSQFRLSCAAAGVGAFVRLSGDWAWKGPGGSLDNGARARDRRAGSGPKVPARALFHEAEPDMNRR